MYRITVKRYPDNDELTLFDEEFAEEDMQILSPKLRLEDNDPGELDLRFPHLIVMPTLKMHMAN